MKDLLICRGGSSRYVIVIDTHQEQSGSAAALLQNAIYKTTGASLPILSDREREAGEYEIIVGRTNRENRTFAYDRYALSDIGFVVRTEGTNVILDGGSYKGAFFAVFCFIRTFLGYDPVHPYQTPPHMDTLTLPASYAYENAPRSWAAQIPEAKGSGAHLYMVPTYLMPTATASYRDMGYVIRTAGGKLLVIDSGYSANAEGLLDILRAVSGQEVPEVEYWFMTHIHCDHVDAFLRIGEEMPGAVRVKCFCHHLPSRDFAARWGEEERYDRLQALAGTFCPFREVTRGDVLEVDGVKVEVIFTVTDHFEAYLNRRIGASAISINKPTGDAINNSDTIYKVTADGHSALFIGDFMHFGEDYLYRYHPEILPQLCADMIQVCHHGANFLTQRFYAYVNARIALWSNTLDCWYLNSNSLHHVRDRLYELQLVKNHVAGDGIFPIPFDCSHISPRETACYRGELHAVTFSHGCMDRLLLSHLYRYSLYLSAPTALTARFTPFTPTASLTATLDGEPCALIDGECRFTAAPGQTLRVTVHEESGEERTYTFTVTAPAAKREVVRLSMAPVPGDTMPDASGAGNHARIRGGSFAEADGRCGFRPAAGGGLAIADSPDLPFGQGEFTLSLWVRPDDTDHAGFLCYYGDDDVPRAARRYYLQLGQGKPLPGGVRFRIGDPSTGYDYFLHSAAPLSPERWQHIVLVKERYNQLLYVDGVFSCERSYGVEMNVDGKNCLLLGTGGRGEMPFGGLVGDFRVFNYALREAEVTALYKQTAHTEQ